ncbi:DUF4241 domain-containing protein [Nocardia sp. 2YAB30]|uniref:DUF4241 domain-containing protein n=1 Tax=unclassified Nocardia TaxID=2637762 RepID=UPI003F943D15
MSYGEMWGSQRGMTHPAQMSREVAARRHVAEMGYAVLLAAQERPLALVEHWPTGDWRVYLFDDRTYRAQMIDLEPHGEGVLRISRNTRWQISGEEQYSSGKWDVEETTTISADGQVEIRSKFDGSDNDWFERHTARIRGQATSGPGNVTVQRFSASIEDFLSPTPEFGGWQVFVPLLAQQGHEPASAVVLRDAPAGEEQGPLRATGIEQLFTSGTRGTSDGPAVVELSVAGLLRVPSGRLVVADPGWIDQESLTVTVPPGQYPVTLSLIRSADSTHSGSRVAAAKVTVVDTPASEWEMALRPGQDLGLLGEGQFYGVGVDTGMAAFIDATYGPVSEADLYDLVERLDSLFAVELTTSESEPNLIAFHAGWGDGSYPAWIGRTEGGQVSCVVIDFQLYPPSQGE